VFDLSASNNLMAPALPILLPVLSENEEHHVSCLLPPRESEVRDMFDMSASDNLIAPSLPILFTVLSENETKQVCYI
jgi:hypothetical protein